MIILWLAGEVDEEVICNDVAVMPSQLVYWQNLT
jgi:hypothetical protein